MPQGDARSDLLCRPDDLMCPVKIRLPSEDKQGAMTQHNVDALPVRVVFQPQDPFLAHTDGADGRARSKIQRLVVICGESGRASTLYDRESYRLVCW